MRLRAVAGLITLSLIAGACGFGGDDEFTETFSAPAAQQLPASEPVDEAAAEDATVATMIPPTTLPVFPRSEDYELTYVGPGDELPDGMGLFNNRDAQIEFIADMITAEVNHDWDALYGMATVANQEACPRDAFDSLLSDVSPTTDPAVVLMNNISISQNATSVFGEIDLILPVGELPAGYRIFSVPEIVTNRDLTGAGEVGGLLLAPELPLEVLVIPEYEFEGVTSRIGGRLLEIVDGELKMSENPCLVAEKVAGGVNGFTYWVDTSADADEETT